MTFEAVLMMLGGIGMFLYGMKLMGNSPESAACARMEKILERLLHSLIKRWQVLEITRLLPLMWTVKAKTNEVDSEGFADGKCTHWPGWINN